MKYQVYLYVFAGLIFFSCKTKDAPVEEVNKELATNEVEFNAAQLKNASIVSGKLVQRKMHEQVKLNGMVDVPPQNIVSVSFPMGGYLKSTKLIPGMNIRKGEVIAVMEDPSIVQLQQDYLMAKVKLNLSQQEFERQTILREGNVNAAKIYQQAFAEYESQKVLVKGLEEKLRITGIDPEKLSASSISRTVPIKSPINGFVSKVHVNIGKFVNPSDVLFELINPDDVHAALTVFEKDLPQIRIGQKVQVSFVNDPSKVYTCEVILVTQNVNEDGTSTLHCHFEGKPAKMVPGMFLTGNLIREGANCLTIPESGLVRLGSQFMIVQELAKGKFKMIDVKEGIHENGWVEINSSEIGEDKTYVIENAYAVLSKLKNTAEE